MIGDQSYALEKDACVVECVTNTGEGTLTIDYFGLQMFPSAKAGQVGFLNFGYRFNCFEKYSDFFDRFGHGQSPKKSRNGII